MADCCNDKACEIDALRSRQSATLKAVLGINAVMFMIELAAVSCRVPCRSWRIPWTCWAMRWSTASAFTSSRGARG